MWMVVSLLTIAASLALVLRQLRALGDDPLAKAVILLIWFRFALTGLGETPTQPVAAGQSLLALGTLAAVMATLMILPLSRLRLPRLLPFLGLAGITLLSGLLNGRGDALINAMTLWIMFVVIALLVHRALDRHGIRPVLGCLLAVFSLPVGQQLLSVALGRSMIGQDGTVAYIGNFVHEAVYSTVALCAVWLVTVYPWKKRAWLLAAVGLCLASMVLANYRTLILACLPFLVAVILRLADTGRPRTRRSPLPLVLALLGTLAVLPMLPAERFAELGTAFTEIGNLVKPPQEFSAAEKDILSARAYIGAAYIQSYIDGGLLTHLVGYGPDAQVSYIETHPHNEYLRVLFQTGILGLGLWLGILLWHVSMTLRRVPRAAVAPLMSGYAALAIGSLGTSFFNRPEGVIFVALLCATTWHLAGSRVAAARPARSQGHGMTSA
ncbi:O-antigen ligase family protein [Salipiger mucosus]|uniref:O-antigen polymerase n=1 Tax=Salipiger mucosus DSM 16094 TaxID=1123237 RepID=S9S463_9RHOB|nr:O-antigen ligase family protein [Salipiger mucosus]EPX84975.1 hypothetical protein Salmuc_00572 [Salipiger mucosus DSM 16094]